MGHSGPAWGDPMMRRETVHVGTYGPCETVDRRRGIRAGGWWCGSCRRTPGSHDAVQVWQGFRRGARTHLCEGSPGPARNSAARAAPYPPRGGGRGSASRHGASAAPPAATCSSILLRRWRWYAG